MRRVRLKDIVEIRAGYAFRKSPKRVKGGACLLVQVRDLDAKQGWVNWPLEEIEQPNNLEQHQLAINDILLAARGHRNHAALYAGDPNNDNDDDNARELPAVAASQVLVMSPRGVGQQLLPAYLVWFLNRAKTQEELKKMRRGSSIPFLPVESLKLLEVPLPSYEMQQHILHLNELAQQEAALLTEIQRKRQELMNAVMDLMITGNIQ